MGNNIFINYRRDDTGGMAIAIYQNLVTHFPPETLFKDFNTIKPGYDFVESINLALAQCNVLLVLIGKNWLTLKDEEGQVRLMKDEDYVRIEIARCLQKNIPVIPVLLDRVRMPAESDLPDDLKALRRRQSLNIDNDGFEQDMERLVAAIREITGIPDNQTKAQPQPSHAPHPANNNVVAADKPNSYRTLSFVALAIGILFIFNIGLGTVQSVGWIVAGCAGYCLFLSFQIDKVWTANDHEKAVSLSKKLKIWAWATIIAGLLIGGSAYNLDTGAVY
jgi:hypothetical protein